MSTVSRRRLRDIDTDEDLPSVALPDPRAQDIARLVKVDGELVSREIG
jgi:hypothetical protein